MKQVLYRSPFIPAEWIAAHGFEPCRDNRFADSADGTVPDTEGVCPFMRGFINAASESDCPVILTTMCDQMRHGFNRLEERCDSRAFLFNLPATWQSAQSLELYISELKRLSLFLVSLGGKAPDYAELSEMMNDTDRQRQALRPFQTEPGKIPVAVLGGPLFAGDHRVIELIQQLEGCIVLDGTETGERTLPAPFNLEQADADPLRELARAYFETIPDAFRRPNTNLYRWLDEKLRQRQPRGLIMIRQIWCDLWHAEIHRIRSLTDIPLLDLDVNGEDLPVRTRTRIEAFMETLR